MKQMSATPLKTNANELVVDMGKHTFLHRCFHVIYRTISDSSTKHANGSLKWININCYIFFDSLFYGAFSVTRP